MKRRIPGHFEIHLASSLAIMFLSAVLGISVEWRLPGLQSYTQDHLTRTRGSLPVPEDIAIVAIDEASITKLGRFPWPRKLMARAIDAIAAGQPKAIAVDVLFADPTTPAGDAALAESISRAGNVIVAAQLVESSPGSGPATWILPLAGIRQAAAATAHANVLTESDGAARHLLLLSTDDSGTALRALPLEAVRVAERLPEGAVVDTGHSLVLGSRAIPLDRAGSPVVVRSSGASRMLRPGRIAIDYIGPAGSFSPVTFSFSALLDGSLPASALRGRYVLVGATAAAVGERFPSPFMHHSDIDGNQHGSTMPGVEVLANALNTILRGRYYAAASDGLAFLWAFITAALTLLVLRSFQGRHATLQQAAALTALLLFIFAAGYFSFVALRLVPPLTATTVSFASAGLLGLLRRSFFTSARLDQGLAEIARAGDLLTPRFAPDASAETIARLTGAQAVALFAANSPEHVQLAASFGAPVAARLNGGRSIVLPTRSQPPANFFVLSASQQQSCQILLHDLPDSAGVLVLAHLAGKAPDSESLRIAGAIACGALSGAARTGQLSALTGLWPKTLEDKARTLSRLNAGLVERSRFVDLALRSVEDGLIIAGPEGHIAFANRRAAEILDSTEAALAGRNLFERLAECEQSPGPSSREAFARLLLDRTPIEREITIRTTRTRQYMLRLSAVDAGSGPISGIVASISDITRQKELQQTKNDVISLVSHEMRTPLAAIQGMSELLAGYELEASKRKEMNLAINDEVKRLTRMITEYLNITRLESGASSPRYSPVRVEALLDRTLLLLEPVAAQRNIRLRRQVAADVPAVFADPDLLTRAIENLISNAIKYSPVGREVSISATAGETHVSIEVADQGYGIPPSDLDRIFDKFFRVARLEDADTPGTGLGLALVREIAGLHGGSITVKSELNTGSIFTLTLPIEGRQ